MIRKILRATDQRLRKKSSPIVVFDRRICDLARDLKETLKAQIDPEGIGLAAIQIGKAVAMFAMLDGKKIRVIANPEIVSTTTKRVTKAKQRRHKIMEGCLSVPYYYGPLSRNEILTLKFQTETGEKKTEEFSGLSAQIVQHEVDHLNGVLFVDRLLEQNKPLYKLENGEWAEVEI